MSLKEDIMGTEKISVLMTKMAIPSVIAQVINILYNIVDRIYIGHIPNASADALTGVGVAFPIVTFISAFSAFVGAGGAPLSAIWQGKGDKDKAEKILGNGVTMLIFFTAVLMLVFYAFMKPLLYMFGASEATIGYGVTYISIYLIGTLFVELALGLNPYIISQGAAKTGMVSVIIGAAINIALDPVFIFVFDMGVAGAAVATIISQFVSAVWVVGFLVSKKAVLKIKLKNLKPDFKIMKRISALGVSPFVMRSTESLVSIALNSGMQTYGGDLYVGSITIMQSVMQFFSAPLGGFTQGVQPIISYNFGAGKFDRVKKTYRSMIAICAVFSLVGAALIMVFPQFFAGMFTNSAELIALCGRRMPLFISGMLLFGVQMGIQPTFMALGQAKISLFIAALRKIILLIPLAVILPVFFGTEGVYISEPISDFASAAVAMILFFVNIKKILTKDSLDKIQ
ncbi:MAG: MATE family efflux transporter [Clostridiales bacterium]|nr:MATE family efflux transporter [Clostridiales bacterium]